MDDIELALQFRAAAAEWPAAAGARRRHDMHTAAKSGHLLRYALRHGACTMTIPLLNECTTEAVVDMLLETRAV